MLERFSRAYFYCVLRQSFFSLLAVTAVAFTVATQLPNLKIDASSDSLTLEYDKDLDYFREIGKRYQAGDFLVLTYKPNADLFSDAALADLKTLKEELMQVEGVAGTTSILDVPLLYSPPIGLTDIATDVKTLLDAGVDYTLAKKEFLESPVYKDMLLGSDGKTTAILLSLAIDNQFIKLVRQRDALRLKLDTEGLSFEEEQQLIAVSENFTSYSTKKNQLDAQRVERVRDIADDYRNNAEIFLGGVTMITADMVKFIRSDIIVFGLAIIAFIILSLSFIFRQWQFVVLPLATCLLTLTTMLGFLAAIDWRLTVISSNFVALLLIVGLSITIHLIVRYRELSSQDIGIERQENLRRTICSMFKPCAYTLLTTIVAFASLVVSGIRPVIDFGWMMIIGLSIAFVMAFIVIPAGLMLLPKTKPSIAEDTSSLFTLKFSRFTENHGNIIIVGGLIAAIISVVGLYKLEVENRFIDYFHSSTEIHQGMLVIDQQLGGTVTLDIILDRKVEDNIAVDSATADVVDSSAIDGENNEFSNNEFGGDVFAIDPFSPQAPANESALDEFGGDPFTASGSDIFDDGATSASAKTSLVEHSSDYWFTRGGLDQIEAVHDYLETLHEVGKVQSLATVYKVARDLNGRTLNDFELALVRKALPKEIEEFLITPYLASDRDQTRITLRVKETDESLRRNELLKEIKNHLVNDLGFDDEQVHLTGVLVLYNNMLQSLYRSQIVTIGAVFLGIMLMFMVFFRSLSLSLIALVPNMLAALVVLGGMGLVGIPLDMMTITIAAIAVGIGVDDAIHYICRFKHEFAIEKNYLKSMHKAHASIGRAMYYTSATIIIGFSVLVLSQFIPSIYFGLLTGLAMFAAILSSLTLLPKMLLMFQPLGEEERI